MVTHVFQKVLKKAREEGKIDPRLLAWDMPKITTGKAKHGHAKKLQLPPQLLVFPDSVISDLQKIIENIRLIAETKAMQVIGFTGAVPEQGTSTLTALLSLLMAAREKTVYNGSPEPEESKSKK